MAYNALKFKLLLIGDSYVGKTSMMCKFANGTFYTTQKPTIGKDSLIIGQKFYNILFKFY